MADISTNFNLYPLFLSWKTIPELFLEFEPRFEEKKFKEKKFAASSEFPQLWSKHKEAK